METCGGVLLAEMRMRFVPLAPPLSVTTSVTVNGVGTPAGALKVCDGLAAVLVGVPSPKFHRKVSDWFSGSLEPALLNCTANGTGPKFVFAEATAMGG